MCINQCKSLKCESKFAFCKENFDHGKLDYEYSCECPTGFKWEKDPNNDLICVDQCSKLKCEQKNSFCMLNTTTANYECKCLSGFEFNQTTQLCHDKCKELSCERKNAKCSKTIKTIEITDFYSRFNRDYRKEEIYECKCYDEYDWNSKKDFCAFKYSSLYSASSLNCRALRCDEKNAICQHSFVDKKYKCICLSGMVWDQQKQMCVDPCLQLKCGLKKAICKLNSTNSNSYECACDESNDYIWNANKTECIHQCDELTCLPKNSKCVKKNYDLNKTINRYECECFIGLNWNENKTICIDACKQLNCIEKNAFCSKKYYNSYQCECYEGFKWNPNISKCINICEDELKCKVKNSFCHFSNDNSNYECRCYDGMTWNENSTLCIDQCNELNCESKNSHCKKTWNYNTNKYDFTCECQWNYQWNLSTHQCIRRNEARNDPRNEARNDPRNDPRNEPRNEPKNDGNLLNFDEKSINQLNKDYMV